MADPAGSGSAIVEARDVAKAFGATQALKDASLTIRQGSSHALVGRNGAGKSTLVSLIAGLESADSGSITIGGAPVPPVSDRERWKALVSCVYQRPSIVPGASVAENLFLNEQPRGRFGMVDWKTMRREARAELERWGIEIPVETEIAELTLEQRRIIEIARALRRRTPLVILDEPTAELEGPGIKRLLDMLNQLRDSGATFLYISHHLAEMYEVCDDVTILRNGRTVAAGSLAEFDESRVVEAMIGEVRAEQVHSRGHVDPSGPPVLRVDGLRWSPETEPQDLTVRAGEIVGIAGQSVAGGFELAQSLAGLRPVVAGRASLRGAALPFGDVRRSISAGVGFVPQDRHVNGFVGLMSVGENLTMSILDRFGPAGLVSPSRQSDKAAELVTSCGVVTAGTSAPVSSLSGGNQQKVVVGRALASDPDLLILERPTQGVDVASRDALMERVETFVASGRGALMISDEIDELRYCDRVLVMVQGRLVSEYSAGWDEAELISAIEGLDHSTSSPEGSS